MAIENIQIDLDKLMIDVKQVIDINLQDVLKGFSLRYKEYKETYEHVMNIPSVKNVVRCKLSMDDLLLEENRYLKEKINRLTQKLETYEKAQIKTEENISLKIEEAVKIKGEEEVTETKVYEILLQKGEDPQEKKQHLLDGLFKVVKIQETREVLVLEEDQSEEEESEEEQAQAVEEEESESESEESEEESESEESESEESEEEQAQAVAEEESEEEEQAQAVAEQAQAVAEQAQAVAEEEEEQAQAVAEEAEEESEEESEEEEAQAVAVAEEEDEEVFEIMIKNKKYYTTNKDSGTIYEVDEEDNPGEKLGYFKKGKPFFL